MTFTLTMKRLSVVEYNVMNKLSYVACVSFLPPNPHYYATSNSIQFTSSLAIVNVEI